MPDDVKTTPAAKTKTKSDKCAIEGCKRPYRAKGYCAIHYKKWRHGEYKKGRYKICTKEGCRKPRANGPKGSFCAEHSAPAVAPAAAPATA